MVGIFIYQGNRGDWENEFGDWLYIIKGFEAFHEDRPHAINRLFRGDTCPR